MSFMRQFLLGPVFFQTALTCSGGYHLDGRGMPLYGTVGVSFSGGATAESRARVSGVCWMIVCMLSEMT